MHSLIRLRHIVAVARCGSFSIAAEEVGISQPALSRSIQTFEAEYGVRLFDRGSGPVTLTPAGKLAVEHSRALLASAGDFDRDMRLFGQGESGRTGIGMGPMMASMLLPHLGGLLLQRAPQLTFITRVGAPETMIEALLDGTIELIVGNSMQLSMVPGVVEEPLGTLQLVIAVRADHPLAAAGNLKMQDLESFPMAKTYDLAIETRSGSAGAFICENSDILREVVARTDCTWLVSPAFIANELEQGLLVELDVADLTIPSTQTNLIYLRHRTRSPASFFVEDTIRSMVQEISNN